MRNVGIVLVVAMLVAVGGCSLGSDLFKTQADTMRASALDIVQRMADGSTGQFQVTGQGINPRYVAEVAVVYRATAGYEGVSGVYSAGGAGQLGDRQLSDGIMRIAQNEDLNAAEKRLLIKDLIERATPAPTTGPAPDTTTTVTTTTEPSP